MYPRIRAARFILRREGEMTIEDRRRLNEFMNRAPIMNTNEFSNLVIKVSRSLRLAKRHKL